MTRIRPAELRTQWAAGVTQSNMVVLVDTDAGITGIGQGVTVDGRQVTFVETVTEGAAGSTQRRLDGLLTHW